MAFGENPNPIEKNEQQTENTSSKEISQRANQLKDSLANFGGSVQFEEKDGSQTNLLVKEGVKINSFSSEPSDYFKIGQPVIFQLRNGNEKTGKEFRDFTISINDQGELLVNGDKISDEKAMGILDKVEANIKEYKEYKAKLAEEAKLKDIEENRKKQEEENNAADKYMDSIDF